MDYKEKVIALLNSQELSKEQKEKLESIFPELAESVDEKVRKQLLRHLREVASGKSFELSTTDYERWAAWVEKQGEQRSNPCDGCINVKGCINCKNGELRETEQKPAEWSEEDERMFNSALWHVKNSCGNQGKNSGEFEVYNWLKSLKDRVQPQNTWKPSDEQMNALKHAFNDCSIAFYKIYK